MNENTSFKYIPAPLCGVEPHAQMLNIPSDEQLIYKIISVDNLLRSIIGKYLHFSRVDCYADLLLCPQADPNDGRQLPKDEQGNESTKFEKYPDFSASDYYNQSRARTYACCFSLENSNYIWSNYANGCVKGKVCIVELFTMLSK